MSTSKQNEKKCCIGISTRQVHSGADFTKGIKPRVRVKFKTLVLNFVNRMVSQGLRLGGFHKAAKSMKLLSQWTLLLVW